MNNENALKIVDDIYEIGLSLDGIHTFLDYATDYIQDRANDYIEAQEAQEAKDELTNKNFDSACEAASLCKAGSALLKHAFDIIYEIMESETYKT